MERRQFLEGLVISWLSWQVGAIGQAAQSVLEKVSVATKRKRALLIGINQYGTAPLAGAVTDVELVRELLIYRFGFAPPDILTLTDRQSTRAMIEVAMHEHLINVCRPGDVAVVHFSGHGTLMGEESALVPIKGDIIPKSTWQLWLQAIDTDYLTTILDVGFRYPGTPIVGNFRIRSLPEIGSRLSPRELTYQEELRTKVPKNPSLGIILQAGSGDRFCADALWQGFSSGVFTYALTQQLWQMPDNTAVQVILSNVSDILDQKSFTSPEPLLPLSKSTTPFTQLLPPLATQTTAEGVVLTVAADGQTGEAWLGGIPLCPLGYYSVGSMLRTTNALVQIRAHTGLTAKIEIVTAKGLLTAGQLLQEQVRVLPRNLSLVVAMDSTLSRIERIDATSAISTIPHTIGVNAAEQFADCVLSKEEGRYALFTPGRTPFLSSFGEVEESVGSAVKRLRSQFESLLATKLLRLTLNQYSSTLGLKVEVTVQSVQQVKPIVLWEERTINTEAHSPQRAVPHKLAIGDKLACQLQNLTAAPLYLRIFCTDAHNTLMSPSFVSPPYNNDSVIPPQQQRIIPQPNSPVDWLVAPPQGVMEVLIVVSRSPLTQTTELLGQAARQSTSSTGMITFKNPLQIAQALLGDLHVGPNEDTWVLNVDDWAMIGFCYRVV